MFTVTLLSFETIHYFTVLSLQITHQIREHYQDYRKLDAYSHTYKWRTVHVHTLKPTPGELLMISRMQNLTISTTEKAKLISKAVDYFNSKKVGMPCRDNKPYIILFTVEINL